MFWYQLDYRWLTARNRAPPSETDGCSANQFVEPSLKKPLTLILLMWRIWWAHNSIPIYIQQDTRLHSLFITGNCSTCSGWYFNASSGAHTTVSTAYAVDTVVCPPDDRWKYHPKHVEQFPDINKLCNVGSCWIYTGIYLRCTDT